MTGVSATKRLAADHAFWSTDSLGRFITDSLGCFKKMLFWSRKIHPIKATDSLGRLGLDPTDSLGDYRSEHGQFGVFCHGQFGVFRASIYGQFGAFQASGYGQFGGLRAKTYGQFGGF